MIDPHRPETPALYALLERLGLREIDQDQIARLKCHHAPDFHVTGKAACAISRLVEALERPTPAPSARHALSAKWREDAKLHVKLDNEAYQRGLDTLAAKYAGAVTALLSCADELDAALHARGNAVQSTERNGADNTEAPLTTPAD